MSFEIREKMIESHAPITELDLAADSDQAALHGSRVQTDPPSDLHNSVQRATKEPKIGGSKAPGEAGNGAWEPAKKSLGYGSKKRWLRAFGELIPALALTAAGGAHLTGETVDRVVASVGNSAITASDVEREYRLELFIEGKPPSNAEPRPAVLEQVRRRLIDRLLLEDEVQANGIQVSTDDQAVTERFEDARARYPTQEAFEEGLSAVGISEGDLRLHFVKETEVLHLIDRRLRPEATVDAPEVEAYYHNTFVPELARQGEQKPPPLSDVEDRIREVLVQKKINGLLDSWLERLRTARDVKLYGSAQVEDKN